MFTRLHIIAVLPGGPRQPAAEGEKRGVHIQVVSAGDHSATNDTRMDRGGGASGAMFAAAIFMPVVISSD